MSLDPATLLACHCCGLIQERPSEHRGGALECCRCGTALTRRDGAGAARSALVRGCAASALVLYPLAISLPVMRLESFGHASAGSVVSGTWSLWQDGEELLALLVFSCSVVLPLLKLVGLLLLAGRPHWLASRARGAVLRLVEWTGRWGMLDVFLIAVVAAWLKLGDLVVVQAGTGVVAFTGMVLLSLLASSLFDPHQAWDESPG